jgi:hypothetical protein
MIALFGFLLTAVGQNKDSQDVTVDFFYGTWTDSTKTGMTLTKEKKVLRYPERQKKGLEDFEENEISWAYNLFLDRRPIVIEISCTQCDKKPGPKVVRGEIEIVNSRQIYFTSFNKNGEVRARTMMTRNE